MKGMLIGSFFLLLLVGCAKPEPPPLQIVPEPLEIVRERKEKMSADDREHRWWISAKEVDARIVEAQQLRPRVQIFWMEPGEIRQKVNEAIAEHNKSSWFVIRPLEDQGEFHGLSYYDEEGVCVLWSPLPRDSGDLERWAVLGHELAHCFWGRWHSQFNQPRPVVLNEEPSSIEDCRKVPPYFQEDCFQHLMIEGFL